MPLTPLGFTIIFATHGHLLRGREISSLTSEEGALPYLLDEERRAVVLATILEVCDYRDWEPLAIHVRTNQVHAVLTAGMNAGRAIKDFKGYYGRRIVKELREPRRILRWATGGSAFYAFEKSELRWEIDYTLHSIGKPMLVYPAGMG